jgi:hypothetical protein
LEVVGFLFGNNPLKSRFSSECIVSLIFVDSLTVLLTSIGFGGIGLFGGDLSDSSSNRTSTLGRGLWEGPSLPSPILLGQAQEVSPKSRFSSEQIVCLLFVDSITLLQLLFDELFRQFIENSIVGLLNGAPTFGGFLRFFVIVVQ